MTLNEWVSRLMAEGPEDATSQDYFNSQSSTNYVAQPRQSGGARYEAVGHPADEVARVTQAIERLSDRIATAESRQALAISSVERSVREVIGRIDAAEREQMQVAARFEGEVQEVKTEAVRASDRLRRMEEEAVGPRSAEALKALEGALGQVAGHVYEGDKYAREMLDTLRERVERIDGGQEATADAIRDLKQTCTALDGRLDLASAGQSGGIEQAAENLSARVDALREDLGRQLAAAAEARFDRVEQALARMSDHVRSAETRSASAVERMGREVLEVAQALSRRVSTVERSSADAADRVSADVSRIAAAVEDRLGRADSMQAQALEKLGGEIARITERLAERISNAERRSAQAIDDVGEQVARVTERVSERQERATNELSNRIRQSEERTAHLLDEARQRIDDRLAETQRRVTEAARPAKTYDADEALFGEAPFPGYETPPAERPSPRSPPMASNGFDEDGFDIIPSAPSPAPRYVAPRATVGAFEDVELEPNVGFDVDDELIGPATHLYTPAQAATPTSATPMSTTPVSAASPAGFAPTVARQAQPAPDDDEDALLNDALGHAGAAPAAPRFETHLEDPEPFHEAPALTTREVIERARAAARAANDRDTSAKPRGPAGPRSSGDDSVLNSLSFGRSRKPAVGGATGAMVVTGLLVAAGLSTGGYMLMNGKSDAKRLNALSVVQGQDQSPAPAVSGSSPLAAVALAPTPAVQPSSAGPDLSAAYSVAVGNVAAGRAGGLASIHKLADGGYAPAQFYLAQLYQDGKSGVKKDAVESRHWLERAAEGGDRTAMHNLALDLHEGVGGARNAAQAAEWFRRAAELGLLDSQFNLAAIYEHGDGVSANPAEAYKWYLVAGRSGDAEARNGALRVRGGLTPDARAVAERAAADFQPQAANPATMPAAAPTAGSPDFVTAQRALNQLGYYQGPTDGVASQALHMAIASYQRDQSLPTTGNPDPATLGKLSVYTR